MVAAFAPTLRPALNAVSPRISTLQMVATPLDALASPLRKFEAPVAAAAPDGANPLTDLPIEVIGLFALIIVVGIAGLVKESGALSESAPTVELGETREDKMEEAAAAAEMDQTEKEKLYFKEIAKDLSTKRGGSKKKRKK